MSFLTQEKNNQKFILSIFILAFVVSCGFFLYWHLKSNDVGKTREEKEYADDVTKDDFVCGDNITFIYNEKQVTYGTIYNPITGKCWMDRNLGATKVAESYNDCVSYPDNCSYGDLFQWGRLDDGHQIRSSGITPVFSTTDNPGHDNFIISKDIEYMHTTTSDSLYFDWRYPKNNNLWQGARDINNPCPAGWRVPTIQEWQTESDSWGYPERTLEVLLYPEKRIDARPYAMNSFLKLPAGGYRAGKNGLIYKEGKQGYYWSSSVSGIDATNLSFSNASIFIFNYFRVYGLSVRCIKE